MTSKPTNEPVEAEIEDMTDVADIEGESTEAFTPQDDLDGPAYRVEADSRGRTVSQADFNRITRRSLLTGGGLLGAAYLAWNGFSVRGIDRLNWEGFANQELDSRIPAPLRATHEFNEGLWRGLFRDGALAPTFDFAESSEMRINGRHGLDNEVDVDAWELTVVGRSGQTLGTHQIGDFRAMPQTEMTVEHKCVEGWAHIVTWGGVLFSEFLEKYYPEEAEAKFVGLSTPDREFNVGLDMASMLHPQTMLTMDLQREPLSDQHGAPLRLTTPLKYGTKQIKRIGTIEFSDTQPENDYWTVRGYDWYAGL